MGWHVMCSSLNRKCQEANQKIQELQAGQEARADQEQKVKVGAHGSLRVSCTLQAFLSWGTCRHGHVQGGHGDGSGKLASC